MHDLLRKMPESLNDNNIFNENNTNFSRDFDINQASVNHQKNFQKISPKMGKPFVIRGTTRKIVEIITKESIEEYGFRFKDMTPTLSKNNSSLYNFKLNSQLNIIHQNEAETESEDSSSNSESDTNDNNDENLNQKNYEDKERLENLSDSFRSNEKNTSLENESVNKIDNEINKDLKPFEIKKVKY